MFKNFNNKLKKAFSEWTTPIFLTKVDPDKMWEKYLASFPEGSNPIYRERSEHDCSCCRHFVKRFGNLVTIIDGEMVSIWDIDAEYPYDKVCATMSKFVKTEIRDIFLTDEEKMGTRTSVEHLEGAKVKTWDHFYCEAPANCVATDIPTKMGDKRTSRNMLKRCMDELTIDAAQTIIELIDQGSIYRGEEFKKNIQEFIKLKKAYDKADNKEFWTWLNLDNPFIRIRNTAIGTLLIDVSEDVDLETAVKKFESIMAPTNYKRPKALITKKMVKEAEKTINELGLGDSLPRRFARVEDITVNEVLFVNRDTSKKMGGSIFDELDTVEKPRTFKKVKEIGIKDFIKDVLPTTTNLRIMLENSHEPNFVSLIAPEDREAEPLFKWGNNFSWAYNGDITDSMKQHVKNAGGRVDGVLRFSIQWNDEDKTKSDYDAHCKEPSGHIYYSNKLVSSGGNLDVDITQPRGLAVENITWPSLNRMREGEYKFWVHNYSKKGGCGGFSAELEYNGELYEFNYPKDLRNNENVNVATVKFSKSKGLEIIKSLEHSMQQKEIWGVKTGEFVDVSMLTTSPNHWDQQTGNKHYIFALKGCKNDGTPRGFFNEFLKEELTPHKRVFEALGNKMRVEESDDQLSGVGFSSTQNNSVVVEVEGKSKRVMKVNF